LGAHQIGLWHPLHLFHWHAVAATEVAVVGQRDP